MTLRLLRNCDDVLSSRPAGQLGCMSFSRQHGVLQPNCFAGKFLCACEGGEVLRVAGWFWERAEVERDPGNSYDANCVEVLVRGRWLGYLAKEAAEFVLPLLAAGFVIKA